MKCYSDVPYRKKLLSRIRAWSILIVCMLIYMVIVGEVGGGDSRIMTPLAKNVSRIIFFGGAAYAGYRIYYYRKLLRNISLMKEKFCEEQEERTRYLHDKSGGLVVDVFLLVLLFVTCTAALFNMASFYTSLGLLVTMVFLKATAYFLISRGVLR